MAPATTLQLTDEQSRAVTTRRVSVGLSAGAGCGKTSVLTERFLSHLDPTQTNGRPARLGELVAITFTDKAAREMRDRIRRACQTRQINGTTDDEANYWLGVLRQLERARISTIHAFCGSLLRRHAVEAGLDPRFAILEPAQARTILTELIDDYLRERLSVRDERVLDLAFEYGLNGLGEMLRAMLDERHSIDFATWETKTPDELVGDWKRLNDEQVVPALLTRFFSSPAVVEVQSLLGSYPPSAKTMAERCERIADLLPKIRESVDRTLLEEVREAAKIQGGGGKKAFGDDDLYERFKSAFTAFREEVDGLLKRATFHVETARQAAAAGLSLLHAVRPVIEAYETRKRDLGFLDFDDLLIRARDLLFDPQNESLVTRLSAGIQLLLVDEFQDTDPLQMRLVNALCGDPRLRAKLFFVGDFKQSIYRFRGADPRVFHDLLSEISPEGQLHLTENFRSQPAILRFVNALFSGSFGESYHALRPRRQQLSPEPAVEFLWSEKPTDDDADAEKVADQRRREARWIAKRLRQLLEDGEPRVYVSARDGQLPTTRTAKPGDMAILFRAMSDAQFYEEALRAEGLDYYVVGGRAFYAQQEIYDIVNLLRAVESPADDVSLAGALRSPLFSLSDETLFWLAQYPGGLGQGFFVRELPPALDDEQRARVTHAAATITSLRSLKNRLPIAALLNEAMRQTGYDAALLAEFLGERKLANLRKLIEQARSFDGVGAFTLADFIARLVDFVVSQPDEAVAATHAEDSDVIRLMSIHQSKGLEFPIVVVPDLERPQQHPPPAATFDPDWGPLVRRPQTAVDGALGGLELFHFVERANDDAERLRLLYVATTRAADYLILSSSVRDLDEPREAWLRLLAERFDLRTGACKASVSASEKPQVRVTLSEPQVPKADRAPRSAKLSQVMVEAQELAQQGAASGLSRIDPIEPDLTARRQFSFSRLSGKLQLEQSDAADTEREGRRPADRDEARGLGTLVHELLATPTPKAADLADRVRAAADRHGVLDEATVTSASEMLERFATSSRARAIAESPSIHRELEFLLAWPPEGADESGVFVHGFIDCLYQDPAGRWHIVDYKTNQLAIGGVTQVAAGYELQLLLYALAVERTTGQPPVSLVLHFLRTGEEHTVAWDNAARTRLQQLMTQALAAARRGERSSKDDGRHSS